MRRIRQQVGIWLRNLGRVVLLAGYVASGVWHVAALELEALVTRLGEDLGAGTALKAPVGGFGQSLEAVARVRLALRWFVMLGRLPTEAHRRVASRTDLLLQGWIARL